MTLLKEIHQQADVIENLISTQMNTVQEIANRIKVLQPKYIFVAARGTSDNAARYANYVWGSINGLPVALATPSLFSIYKQPPKLQDSLVVGISQSGQSPDIVSVLKEARRQNVRTLAVVNAPESPLAQAADWVIDIKAGLEQAVAATKTYTAELMIVAMLAAALQEDPGMLENLSKLPGWVRQVLKLEGTIARLAERYRFMERCVVIGRGYNYATAFEWSLKLKELSYIVAEPYSSADFLHGPIAIVEHGFPVLVVATSGEVYQNTLDLVKVLRQTHAAELVIISDQPEVLSYAQSPIPLPTGIPEWLSPLVTIVPAQLFTHFLTSHKGYSTETPRSIRKVTETQ